MLVGRSLIILRNLSGALYGRIDNLGKSDVMTTTYSGGH